MMRLKGVLEMAMTSKVKEYYISPESEWIPVQHAELETARKLIEQAREDFYETISPIMMKLYSYALGFGKLLFPDGYYDDEIRSWAKKLGVSFSEMVLINHIYELSHLDPSTIYGCTAGIKTFKNIGPVHIRNMDWPLSEIGNATRVFHFLDDYNNTLFTAVSVPGFVGVLSGMVKGGYSVTINWAPPVGGLRLEYGRSSPTMLLRKVLETCTTYDEAVSVLSETPLITSVFYTVCGVEDNEGCVIERTPDEYVVREMTDVIGHANHHVAEEFDDNNDDLRIYNEEMDPPCLYVDSDQRVRKMVSSLKKIPATTNCWDTVASPLDIEPIFCGDTYQQMLFNPRTGKYKVWRFTS